MPSACLVTGIPALWNIPANSQHCPYFAQRLWSPLSAVLFVALDTAGWVILFDDSPQLIVPGQQIALSRAVVGQAVDLTTFWALNPVTFICPVVVGLHNKAYNRTMEHWLSYRIALMVVPDHVTSRTKSHCISCYAVLRTALQHITPNTIRHCLSNCRPLRWKQMALYWNKTWSAWLPWQPTPSSVNPDDRREAGDRCGHLHWLLVNCNGAGMEGGRRAFVQLRIALMWVRASGILQFSFLGCSIRRAHTHSTSCLLRFCATRLVTAEYVMMSEIPCLMGLFRHISSRQTVNLEYRFVVL